MRARFGLCLLMLTGCERAPDGQVVARIDGVEITDREMLSEAMLLGADANNPILRPAMRDRLIDRKLLANAARRDLIDEVPAVQLERRRAVEEVLARAYARRITERAPPPDARIIDRFIAANPHRFARRSIFLLDRLVSPRAPAVVGDTDWRSIDDAGRALDRATIAYTRERVAIDSDSLTAAAAAALGKMTPGVGNLRKTGPAVTVEAVIDQWPIVEDAARQRDRARAMLKDASGRAALARVIKALRTEAKIVIRPEPVASKR